MQKYLWENLKLFFSGRGKELHAFIAEEHLTHEDDQASLSPMPGQNLCWLCQHELLLFLAKNTGYNHQLYQGGRFYKASPGQVSKMRSYFMVIPGNWFTFSNNR